MTAVIQTTISNFMLLNRLIMHIALIMKVIIVTKEIIFAARECLVIGG